MKKLLYSYGDAPISIVKYKEAVTEKMHTHDFLELQYVSSGRGFHVINNKRLEVKPGNMFFTSLGVAHCFVSESDAEPLLVTNCVFRQEVFDNLPIHFDVFPELGSDILYNFAVKDDEETPVYIRTFDSQDLVLAHLLDKMEQETLDNTDGRDDMLITYLTQLIITFLRLHREQTKDDYIVDAQREYINEILLYIKHNYNQKISLRKLSQIAAVSPNHLCFVFKNITGKTMSEYIREARLQNVCRMLRETDMSFSDIASENGYEGHSFLTRIFIKTYGMTPGEYRKASQTKND